MSIKISLLPDHIANQIAAGEVVQRPASVVKELLENAIDAKSTSIKVVIKDAGTRLIHVTDNGDGMNEIDARMCFERHATSKIKTDKDLLSIQTLGFRGEALASIAAVAQIDLTTREAGESLGTHITLSASTIQKQTPTTAPFGTTISVKNLFFNVPARRNFLKTPAIEKKHIIDEFQRIALANPQIAFHLYQNNTSIYQLPPQKTAQRIIHLFGKNYQNKLLPCQVSTDLLQIHGYIAPPKEAKKTRGQQFFFVNNRYIKNNYLHHAVKKAFEGLLPPDTFPFYVLYINLPATHIDVNVHPTKTEIKFQEETLVYGIVKTAIQRALATYHITPALDIEQTEGYNSLFHPTTTAQQDKNYMLFKSIAAEKNIPAPPSSTSDTLQPEPIKQSDKSSSTFQEKLQLSSHNLQLHNKYIIAQIKSGMLLIDQHAAEERIIYERILDQTKKTTINTQQLLLPTKITLQPGDLILLQACNKELQTLGFQYTIHPPTTLTVTGIPPEIQHQSIQMLFEELIEQFKCYKTALALPKKEKWARTMAKRMQANKSKKLLPAAVGNLIEKLFACKNPNYTPDGKRIWKILTLEKLSTLLEI